MALHLHSVDWSRLPRPEEDGAADHLKGSLLPEVALPSTDGDDVNLAALEGLTIVYAYPMTAQPGKPLPAGWDDIPGARGCTPQACAFRDQADEMRQQGVRQLFGLSTQSTHYQQEAASRLHLPFSLLSDRDLTLTHAMRLPTIEVGGITLTKRLTLAIQDGRIVEAFYPVFPPDEAPAAVVNWLRLRCPREKITGAEP